MNSLVNRSHSGLCLALLSAIFCCTSCVAVKDYQKMYLNDQDMELSSSKVCTFENNFQTYREGPSGANGGKIGGGCGCN